MKFTRLMCVCGTFLMLFTVGVAQASNGGYDAGYNWWGSNRSLNYDTSAPTKGYAKNPDEVYNAQIIQAKTGLPAPVQYASIPQVYSMPQQQVQQETQLQPVQNITPANYNSAPQGYVMQQAQHLGAPLYADPYHAQMESKARELTLKQTDLAIKNVDRQDLANDRAERRDKNYSIRDGFSTFNSALGSVVGVTNFIRSW